MFEFLKIFFQIVRSNVSCLESNLVLYISVEKAWCPLSSVSLVLIVSRLSHVSAGAIIGDGDRKRAPFLVLGLAPWYGTIFLFLEQIVPSPAAHAHTCCENFCGCRAGEMASEIHEIRYAFSPQLNMFMSVRIWLKNFRRKLLQFEWSKAVLNLGMSSFISLIKLCSATSFHTRTSHFSTLTFTNVED